MINYTEEQIIEMRKKWDIAENFVPVATAGGALAWVTKNSLTYKNNQ